MKRGKILILLILTTVILALGIGGILSFASEEEPSAESKGEISVWLIAGQSNAVGYGYGAPEAATVDSRYVDGFENVIYYGSRAGKVTSDFLPTSVGMGKGSAYCGAELGIAGALGNSDKPHAIIKYAVGGTSLYPITTSKTWTSDSYVADVNSDDNPDNDVDTTVTTIGGLYDAFMKTVTDGLALLKEDGYTPVIKGLLWSQGGAESGKTERANEYAKLLYHLVKDMRKDLSVISGDPSINDNESPLPFVIVKTYRNPDYETEATLTNIPIINEAQRTVMGQLPEISIIDPSTVYNFSQSDAWHYSTEGQVGTGELFISEIMAKEGKYLVTSDGLYSLVDIGYHTVGESVTAKFTTNPNYSITSVTMQVGKGEKKAITLGDNDTYSFTMPSDTVTFEVKTLGKNAVDTVTPYGTIPKEYFVSEDYPIAIFDNNGFVNIAQNFNADADKKVAAVGDGAILLLRRDYDMSSDPNGGNYLSGLNGNAVYDLGGYTVSIGVGSTADALIKCDAHQLKFNTVITMKNGKILMGEDPIVRFSGAESRISDDYLAGASTNPQKYTVTLDSIDIGLDKRVTDYTKPLVYSNEDIESSTNKNLIDASFIVKNCNFDLSGTTDSFNLFCQSNINIKTQLIGSSIKVNTLDGITINHKTALTVKGGVDGEYLTVISASPFSSTERFNSDNGKTLGLTLSPASSGEYIYKLTNVDEYTPYGSIPSKYASATDYPWLVYYGNECIYGGTDFSYDVFKEASAKGNGTVIYLRTNVNDSSFTSPKNAQSTFNGTITVDLGSHTVTMTTKALLRSQVVQSGYNTNVILKNGTILTGKEPIARFAVTTDAPETYAEDSKTAPHKFTVTFENLSIKRNPNATEYGTRICSYSGSNYDSTVKFDNNLIAKDCNFDFTDTTDAFTIFASNSAMGIKVSVIGGTVKAPNLLNTSEGIRLTSLGGGSINVKKNEKGEYIKLILPSLKNAPSTKYTDGSNSSIKDLRFYMTKRGADENEFTLISSSSFDLSTPYGYITTDYASAVQYPFALFAPDSETGELKFIAAYTDYGFDKSDDTATYPLSALYTAYKTYKSGAVVYLRRDFDYDAAKAFSMIGSIRDIVIDLGDHTITDNSTHYYGLLYMSKKQATDTTITFKNGTIVLDDRPLISVYSNEKATTGTNVNCILENLRIECAKNASLTDILVQDNTATAPETAININITLNECIIDLSNLDTINATLFNANMCKNKTNEIKFKTVITVNGGEIIALKALNLSDVYTENGSAVIFTKLSNGNYTLVKAPSNLKFLSQTVSTLNEKTLNFVKISEADNYATYRLRPTETLDINFVPKTSITLGNELVMNVYVPSESVVKFTFNDVPYKNLTEIANKMVTIDGKYYYHFAVALGSSEAAKELTLTATLSSDNVTATANFTFSIPKYAEKVMAIGSKVEKNLAKNVLSYIRAAYNYEGFASFNTDEEIARVTTLIDSIIGEYIGTPVSSGLTNTIAPVTSVTLNLDSKPAIRFYVTDSNIEFYRNSKKLNTVVGTDTNGAYVDLDVYAYELCETITYGENGSYHISSFLTDSNGTNYETLVKCFVGYVESAFAYRESVIGSSK